MKSTQRYWKIAALVMTLLILGMAPVQAQEPNVQNAEQFFLPLIGASPSADLATAGEPVKDGLPDRNLDRFVAMLEHDGFVVQEGRMGLFSITQVCCAKDSPVECVYANAAKPYSVLYLPPSPGQTTEEFPYARDPEYPDQAVAWRLRPDEAVVFVGLTPPPVRYFGFQSYRFYTTDDLGNRVRKWDSLGDGMNHLTISTAGTPNGTPGNPFSSLTLRITTADRGIDARVRAAARRAGFPSSIMNTDLIPQSIVRMGLDEDADSFNIFLRAAMPDDSDALDEYKNEPPVRVFRVTPKTDAPVYPETSPDPFDVPSLRVHGTGHNEFSLLPAVRGLRKAILSQYDDLQAVEFTSQQVFFPGFHHLDLDDDGYGPATDALYLMTTQSFGTLEEDEFIIAYGVNHHATGKAAYMNINIYGLTKYITADDVDDLQLAGTAAPFLGADYPDVAKLYAYKFARHCADGEASCFEVPVGCCSYQDTPRCVDEPGCAGLQLDEQGVVVWRAYLDPLSKTGPDPMEVIFDRAIKFSPQP